MPNNVECLAAGILTGLCLGVPIGAFFGGLFHMKPKQDKE
jgi:hypothetical protein